jgi:hypothetical protein
MAGKGTSVRCRSQIPRRRRTVNDAGQIAAKAKRNCLNYAVRLDPIRPMLDRAPELPGDDDTPLVERIPGHAP